MDWRSEYETSWRVLHRIVATLLALADLAHRADGLPGPVRWLVVHILRKAEGVAREFVFGSTGSDDVKDATDLARTFRTLALVLRNTLRQLRRKLSCRVVREASGARKGHRRPAAAFYPLFANGPAFAAQPHPDTS